MSINFTPSAATIDSPAISVIIPIYNEEKYIGKCLAGLLTQTFEDFEVIVIDDCSSDNSVAIVEGYAEKFSGRFTLVHSEEKAEYAGFLRNKGIELAGGEYVFFINTDAVITSTALEEMYSAAKKFNADVVHCKEDFFIPDKANHDAAYKDKKSANRPTLLTDDFERRIRDFSQKRSQGNFSVQLIRRDFLVDTGIHFLDIYSQDMIFTMCELCCAKNYLLLPNVSYHWRQRSDLNAQETLDAPQTIQRYVATLRQGVNYLDEILNGQEFFAARADLKYMLFDKLFAAILERLNATYQKNSAHELCKLLRKEFDSDNAFTAFLFNAMNIHRLQLNPPQEFVTAPAVEVLPAIDKEQNFFPKKFPAVSVIIPMYNVEKYVGECLDSLLAQTFQNFEVIVVDDCSTDNSVRIVNDYAPKFEGRLKFAALEENSGGAGFPRNKGIELARGEYLSFIDPDDTITSTALEELYSAAKNFDADVVQCEKWYQIPDEFYHDVEYRKKLKPTVWPTLEKIYITQPIMLTKDFERRIIDFSKMWLTWSVCLQFVRRDFIIDNRIQFVNIHAEDMIFTMCELCCAKNYVVLPNVFYFYRLRAGSAIREAFDVQEIIHKYAKALKQGINYLDEILNRQEFFAARADLQYILFKTFATGILSRVNRVYTETPIYMLDRFLRKEFADAFEAFTFNALNAYRLQLNLSPKRIVVPEFEDDYKDSEGQDFFASKMPAVSVIIPLYNSEKYIGELLDSILAQTFQNFEVIVVDDCSTDDSRAVVESYAPKFHGRLRLTATEKNTGSPGDPSNIGMDLSRGEYLFILDNDDAITPDALEKLYHVAKNFNADVVSCENFYLVPEKSWDDAEFRKNLKPHSYKKGDFVNKPTLIPFDIARRVRDCYDHKFLWSLWAKLIRRDLMIENRIRCTNNIIQDMLVTCCLIYTAKRFVCVPYAVYFWRMQDKSLSNKKREPIKKLKKYLSALTVGMKYLDGFLSKREVFRQNPKLMHTALDTYFQENMNFYIQPIYDEIPANEREEALRKEFAEVENAALTAFLFNDLTKILNGAEDKIAKFLPYLTGRIDIQLNPKNESGNLQIVSVSDDKADIARATWLAKNAVGYAIQSRKGSVEIVAKATTDGQFKLYLRGMWVQNPDDNSKLLPYWIDYTSLTVNGKNIFDKITPTWHDAPFIYDLDVKAGEEIKINVEWQPHRSDVAAVVATQKVVEPVVKKFLPYLMGRADIQLSPKTGAGDLQIVSVSDDKAEVIKASWLPKSEVGYAVQSHAGSMSIVAKATTDGQFKLYLRGMWVQNPDDNSKLLPYWIDYTKLTVNGNTILDKITPAWHDAPFNYNLNVKADEEITVDVEWQPHRSDVAAPPKKVEPINKKFLPYLTARADIQLRSKTDTIDFQILSVSDDKADVRKPVWFQKGGVGYMITSHSGKMTIVAKGTEGGQLQIFLKALDVRAPEDDSKRIPYWIDYTKLSVNGKIIFDKVTPTWHDAPFNYNLNVKADEEIVIQTEWLPHKGDTPGVSTVVAAEPIKGNDAEIVSKFKRWFSARLDLRMTTKNKNDFQIVSISDDRADVRKPGWFNRNAVGYVIQSYAGKLDIVFKVIEGGPIEMNLKGLFYTDPKDKSKHIPYWVDYTKFTVNDKIIFKKLTPIWHDKPYNYTMEAKAGEEVKIQVEWLPHRSDT